MKHRQAKGTIVSIGDTVGERGREWFHRTVRPDGTRLVRTVSEIDDADILRDVTYALDDRFRPLDCYERLTVRGETSMAWFHFTDNEIVCEGMYADLGRVSQRKTVTARPPFFGPHPLTGDAMVPASYDFAKGGRQAINGYLSSPMTNGSTGPLAYPFNCVVESLGDEDVTVPAGTFRCHALRIYYAQTGDPHALYEDVWVTEEFSFVKLRNDELFTTYLLTSYEEWE